MVTEAKGKVKKNGAIFTKPYPERQWKVESQAVGGIRIATSLRSPQGQRFSMVGWYE